MYIVASWNRHSPSKWYRPLLIHPHPATLIVWELERIPHSIPAGHNQAKFHGERVEYVNFQLPA